MFKVIINGVTYIYYIVEIKKHLLKFLENITLAHKLYIIDIGKVLEAINCFLRKDYHLIKMLKGIILVGSPDKVSLNWGTLFIHKDKYFLC